MLFVKKVIGNALTKTELSRFVPMTKSEWLEAARTVLASRIMDTIEETEFVPKGLASYQFSATGHELSQVLVARCLTHGHDGSTVYYRSRPFVLAAGMTLEEGFAGPLGRAGSRNGGRDIGVVHHLPNRRGVTVLPSSGDVGAQYTPAVGWAQAIVYHTKVLGNEQWKGAVAVAHGGDGSTASNGFWSALNIATTMRLPMIFYIADNGWGISVPSTAQTPGGNIAENLASFTGLRIVDIDGTNPEEASRLIEKSIAHVRETSTPTLMRIREVRICGHSSADNQSYKTAEQRTDELNRDPIPRLKEFLIRKKYLDEEGWSSLYTEVEADVRAAAHKALEQPEPAPDDAFSKVFAEPSLVPKHGGMAADGLVPPAGSVVPDEQGVRINMIDGIRKTLDSELTVNPRVLVFGEDVGVKGGVHGATVDLQRTHGPDRVFDTSLSEEGIIGRSIGLAIAGLVPVPEIQFRKYLDPAMEPINDTGTLRWRTNGDFAAPYVVRIPVGYSKRTGDPWHSVSGEAIFAHTIGWRVAFPSTVADAVGLLRSAIRGNDPTFFLEHRDLLDTRPGRGKYPGDNYVVEFGRARMHRSGTRATIVAWGEMVHRATEAADRTGADVDVIDLRTIVPWDKEMVFESVRRTGRCMVVHEDTITCGFGAEVSASISQELFAWLDAPVIRIATANVPIPYNKGMMHAVLPNVDAIANQLRNLMEF